MSGGSDRVNVPSPSAYVPLVNAQTQANRVNQITPYGTSIFRATTPDMLNLSQSPQTSPITPNATSNIPSYVRNSDFRSPADPPINRATSTSPGGSTTLVTELSPEIQSLFDQQIAGAGGDFQTTASPFGVGESAVDEMLLRAMNPELFNDEIQQATFDRSASLFEPKFQRQSEDLTEFLSLRGIPIGSEAYNDAFSQLQEDQNLSRERAALSAVIAGNEAALRSRGQGLAELSTITGQGLAGQGQAFQQELAGRTSQFNELASILGQTPTAPIHGVDVMGPANIAQNVALANQANQSNAKSSNVNAGAGLGAAAIMASDRKLKREVTKIGEYLKDVFIYRFKYLWSDDWQVGVMADEVEKVNPGAVLIGPNGYKWVNYNAI